MPESSNQHEHRIRARYAETDQMGVVHHAAYVPWLEEARIEWLRAHGQRYRDLEATGVLMPVVELNLRYQKVCRFDDELVITTVADQAGPSRIRFTSTIASPAGTHAEAVVTVATVDAKGRPIRVPAHLAGLLAAQPI